MTGVMDEAKSSGQPAHIWRRVLLVALLIMWCLLDRWVKALVVQHMTLGESIPLIQGVFHLTYLENSGVAFSLFSEHPHVLTWVTSAFFLGFLIYVMTRPILTRWHLVIFPLILGGALGNLWDRLTRGQVIDYLDVTCINYPVFNLADMCIFCGVALLILHTLREDRQPPGGDETP